MPELRQLDQSDAPEQATMMSAGDFRYDALAGNGEALKALESTITEHLDEVRKYCKQGRDHRNFDRRRQRNRDRAQCKVRISENDDGSVNKTVEDAHAKLGINQGWTFQSNTTASKEIFFKLFRSSPRFYVPQGWGNKVENEKLENVIERVSERLLRKGAFYSSVAPQLCQMLAVDGSVFLRFDFTYPHRMKLQADGSYRESMEGEQPMQGGGQMALFDKYKALTPQFTIWKPEDVLVTDWDMPSAKDQEGIFYMTPQTTVRRLEREEAVFVWEGQESDVGLQFIRHKYGRFINMKSLREHERKNIGNAIKATATKYQVSDSRTSSFPPFTLVEYEGMLPMSKWVEAGTLTPELAQYFEINVGMTPQRMVDPMTGEDQGYDKNELIAWGQRLDAIRYWEVAYTSDNYDPAGGSAGISNGIGQHLLQLRPCPYQTERTSLYNFVYFPDRDEFLGMSICDAGWRLENVGDLIRNAQAWRKVHNSNPSGTVFKDFMENPKQSEVEKVLNPGHYTNVTKHGMGVPDIVNLNKLEGDPDDETVIQAYKFEFENTVGIPPIAKGNSQDSATGTATELTQSLSRSSGLLDMVAYRVSIILAEMVKEMIQLSYEILGEDEWRQLAIQASGRVAADLDHVMNEIANGEFDIVSALANTDDPAVQASLQQRLYQLTTATAPQEWNHRNFIKSNAKLQRLPDIETCLNYGEAAMTPQSEHFQMAEGNTVKVHPDDDDMIHLQEHSKMAAAVETGEALMYFSPEHVAEIQKQVRAHMMAHEVALQQKMAMQQEQMGGGGSGAGQLGKAKGPRQDGKAAMETDTKAAGSAGLHSNIQQRAQMP